MKIFRQDNLLAWENVGLWTGMCFFLQISLKSCYFPCEGGSLKRAVGAFHDPILFLPSAEELRHENWKTTKASASFCLTELPGLKYQQTHHLLGATKCVPTSGRLHTCWRRTARLCTSRIWSLESGDWVELDENKTVSRKGIVLLCSVLGWPHLEFWGSFGHQDVKKDIEVLESVHRRVWRCWRVWRGGHVRSSWGHLVCSAGEDWGQSSLCSSTALWGKLRGSSELCSVWQGQELGTAGAVSGESQAGYQGKVLPPEGAGHWTGSPGNGHSPKAARAPGVFGELSQGCTGWDCWGVCAGPEVLHHPCGSLPSQLILWFYSLIFFPSTSGNRHTHTKSQSISKAEQQAAKSQDV